MKSQAVSRSNAAVLGAILLLGTLFDWGSRDAWASTIARYNFAQGSQGWAASDTATGVQYTSEGMSYTVTGDDSYVYSPPADYPADKAARIVFRMRSTASAGGEIFWGASFSQARRKDFTILNDGQWHEYQIDLPALGAGARVRIDTNGPVTGATNQVTIAWVQTQAALVSEVAVFWDFTTSMQGWAPLNQVTNSRLSAEGWAFDSTGNDPYVRGPLVNFPTDMGLRVTIRLRTNVPDGAQLFFAVSGAFNESQSVRFGTSGDGAFHDYELILPPLGANYRFRLDPLTQAGPVTVASIKVETIVPVDVPLLYPPTHPQPAAQGSLAIGGNSLRLIHNAKHWGGWVLEVDGQEMAAGHDADLLGYNEGGFSTFVSLRDAAVTVTSQGGSLTEQARLTDGGGRPLDADPAHQPRPARQYAQDAGPAPVRQGAGGCPCAVADDLPRPGQLRHQQNAGVAGRRGVPG